MMMANGGTNYGWPCDGDDGVDLAADDDSMSMDIESLMSILDERPPDDYSQNGLADPSLSNAPCNEPASHVGVNDPQTHDDHSEASASRTVCSSGSSDSGRQRVNYGFTKVEPLPDVSSMHFSSRSLADWACPFPSDDNSNTANTIVYPDFSSSSHYDTRETNFERANRGGSFGISDSNGNDDDQLMDKYGITDGIYCNSDTPDNVDTSFVDISEYPNILYDQDDEFSMPFSMNLNELSYPGTSRLIYNNNGMLFNDMNTSEQHLMPNASSNSARNYETIRPSSESSSDTHAKWSTSSSMLPNKIEKSFGVTNQVFAEKGFVQSFSGVVNSFSSKDHVIKGEQETKRPHQFIDIIDSSRLNDSSIKKQQIYTKEERESKYGAFTSKFVANSKVSHITCIEDDEPDVIIIEDMSDPARKKQPPVDGKSLIIAQRSSLGAPAPPTHMGYNNARVKTNDERFIYRVALQDLSPPKSEASAPDGSLAVSLLRHQRIALSWMVQKETKSMHCCGGILADDQGLGKTISTIALILKERSPSSSVCTTEMKKIETKTYNLDDDGGAVTELDESSQKADSAQTNSRLAAGTLVVCPTSVLRQWNDELHNKVSTKANLSVLIYHGANRTKDPSELAKFDVVLTTYAIVSMEVPKQAFVNEDEDETRKRHDLIPVSSGKKRKYPPSSSKSSKKDNDLESLARPLAKVRWFRVVLDEAQSIKNYRTGVARSCWGLKAKRRWCLSGTPIQNAIDDLYSYFRFLRYDPYCVYKSFCSGIKAPIQRNPGNGYKKLQAVLKTIMLRRTKGTLLDGEPIISLPPKTINLKKVDFTAEERDFYCRLEADSRAQFAEYAAAGTVKQNYVNILLMLLRLRQACDHPLLVRGCSSGSEWKSSIEKAKKLPIEIRSRLLNCLEASLAICSICSDVPEDAVVTTCEHVFCNQCILEHLSSDDSQCPSSKCKVILSNSSVFTKSTLRLSLDNNNAPDSSCSSKPEILEPCSSSGSVNSSNIEAAEALDSSKIKAAVEVLHSIAKPRGISVNSNDLSGVFENDSNEQKLVVREKAIVFSQWTRMLDLFEACLKDSSIGYRRLDGTMSVVARDKAVKDFNTLPEVTVMIMSLKAASLGLNMVAACHVLLLDLWWNPTTEDQAIDRAHRIGQTRPVSVLRLTVKDTVEDRILALQQKKREMVSSAFGEDETGSGQTRLTVDDLKYLFQA